MEIHIRPDHNQFSFKDTKPYKIIFCSWWKDEPKPISLAQIQAEYNKDVEVTEMETKDALKWLKHDIMIAVCYDCGKRFWKDEKSDEICSFCANIKSETDYLNQPNK